MACLAALFLWAPLLTHAAADGATVTYQRLFKGSSPELIEIKVGDDGRATYDIRQLADPADPQALEIGARVREKIFQLTEHLHNFEGADFDVHRRMADLGQKTFRYEKGTVVHETKYNYTLNREAGQLAIIFEGLAQQQQDLLRLTQKLKYDRLGVNDVLREFEHDLDSHTLPEPERLLPILDGIAADSRVVEIARQRARTLAERIRTSTSN
jgi:hypothetical protein